MRVLVVLGFLVLIGLQVRAWFGDSGYFARNELSERFAAQRQRTDLLRDRNRILAAEVQALRTGLGAVEARARRELGMIKSGETFYLVVEPQ